MSCFFFIVVHFLVALEKKSFTRQLCEVQRSNLNFLMLSLGGGLGLGRRRDTRTPERVQLSGRELTRLALVQACKSKTEKKRRGLGDRCS